MAIETQNGDYNLTSAVTVYSKTAAADHEIELEVNIGDGSKDLDSGVGTLTLKVTNDGKVVGGDEQPIYKGAQTRAQLRTGKIFITNGDTVTVTLESSNASDTDVDVTVTPRGTGVVNPNQFYVGKSGSNSNDGRTWETAKLTIGGAVAAAVDGNIVSVGPGTFSEQVNLATAGKSISLQGAGIDCTVLIDATGTTLTLDDNCGVRDMSVVGSNSLTGVAIYATNKSLLKLSNVFATGHQDGILFSSSCNYVTLDHVWAYCDWDAANIDADNYLINNSYFYSNGTYRQGTEYEENAAGLRLYGKGILVNSIIEATKTHETSKYVYGLLCTTGHHEIKNSLIRASITNASSTGDADGLTVSAGAIVIRDGGDILASNAKGYGEHEVMTSGGSTYKEQVFAPADDAVTVSDKTGFSLADIDGLSSSVVFATMLASLVGQTSADGNTITYKQRDGETDVVTVTIDPSTPGVRTGSVIAGEGE